MKPHVFSALPLALICANSFANTQNSIEKITVEGQKYLSISESNSIKTPTPIIDVPQSLSIISAEEITARGINSIAQIIDYLPGVNTSQGEGHRDSVVFRGVRSTADFFLDGNRDDVQYFRALYNVEQVEVLRGPNALLFGRGGTGGVLNRVSKKALLEDSFFGYKAKLDSFGGGGLSLDSNVSLNENTALRINAMYEQLENHRDFFDGERIGITPTLRVELSDTTLIDLSYEYINHDRFIDRGIPTNSSGRPVEELKNNVFADPENNYHSVEADVFRANVQHQFSDEIKGNFNAFYGDYDKVYSNYYVANYDEANNQVELDGYIDETQRTNLVLSANLIGEFTIAGLSHTLIAGAELVQTNSDQYRINPVFSSSGDDREWFTIARPINFVNGTGVNSEGAAFTVTFSDLNDDTRVDLDVFSAYLQDEIKLTENFHLVLGARFDQFEIQVFNADPNVLETRTRKDEEISPRAGIIYKPQESVSIYLSYSESFLPRSGEQYANINGSNNALDPDTFSNQEVGIKWDMSKTLSLTAAYFENQQSSPQVADADPQTLDVIDSEIKGVEFQLIANPIEALQITANYSYLEGEIVERTGPTGRTPRELPENSVSIWSRYEVSEKLAFALGATYQGKSFITSSNSAFLPSYTRLDAAAYYDFSDDLRLQLNIENLTDTLYFPNAHSTHQVTVGAPVNASLSILGRF
ncbi:TonB-dependent receptor [Glaciecola sp. 1036]|uniref:TonB-dependent receptor n=1 Tax=Alteromonadaceae TaxID=72275 RepID=UPI003D02BF66